MADVTSSGVNLNNRELRRGDGFLEPIVPSFFILLILKKITARDTGAKVNKKRQRSV